MKYTHHEPQSIEQAQKSAKLYSDVANTEPLANNPLEKHLKFLGRRRTEMLHRNGGSTIVHSAIFEAKSPGRFNLGVTSSFGAETSNKTIATSPASSTPIIIVDPGTPVTALLWKEDTITYADKGRFSSHSGNNFLTNLLLLQPGDVFSLDYSTIVQRRYFGNKPGKDVSNHLSNIRPVVHKFPFSLDRNWGFNDWIINYLPADNQR